MFGRSKKIPKVTTNAYELTYEFRDEGWNLRYKNISFYFPNHEIRLPETEELDLYIKWIDSKKEHIDRCVAEMFEGWDVEINKSAAHIAQVVIEKPGNIYVMVIGDDSWGDMGYDLWFIDGVIINEVAGD